MIWPYSLKSIDELFPSVESFTCLRKFTKLAVKGNAMVTVRNSFGGGIIRLFVTEAVKCAVTLGCKDKLRASRRTGPKRC
ncbi:MAG: hypothetical protein QXQ37_05735 [Nitrososphaerota archaeon]